MDAPHAVASAERRIAQALPDVAIIGILKQGTLHRNPVVSKQVQNALTSRVVIEQAKGVLADRNNQSKEAAFWGLRWHRPAIMKVTDFALAVLTTGLDPTVE